MTTNQEGRQAAIRDSTSTAYGVAADWHALFDDAGISAGTWNERLLAWINDQLGTSHSNLPGAMAAYAADAGFNAWSSISTLVLGGASTLLSGETDGLAFDFTDSSARIKDTSTPANEYSSTGIVSSGALVGPSGKLTYTSPSNKLTLQADGYYKYQAHNLCLQSEDAATTWFAGQTGSAIAAAVTANYAANPIDGSQTADRIVFDLDGNTSTGDISLWQQTIADIQGATYVVEIWVRSTDALSSYVVQLLTPGGSVTKTVTGTWAKISTTIAAVGTSSTFGIRTRGGQTPTNSDVADILVFAAHKYRYPANTDYIRTSTAAVYALPLEYSATDGSCLGLLVEEQRTNLCLHSTDFSDSTAHNTNEILPFGSGSTVNAGVSPDGRTNADFVVPSTTSAAHWTSLAVASVTSGLTYTASVYVKAGGYNFVQITPSTGFPTTAYANFNIATGALGNSNAVTGTIKDCGSGWYRISISVDANASSAGRFILAVLNADTASRLPSYAGDGVSGVYFYQGQFEQGSFPTSPVITYGAAASRLADNISIATTAFPHSTSVGSVFAQLEYKSPTTTGITRYTVATGSAGRYIYRTGTNVNVFDGTNAAAFVSGAYVNNTDYKFSLAHGASTMSTATNGAIVASGSAHDDTMASGTLRFAFDGGSDYDTIILKKISYVPRKKSDVELQAETA